MKGWLPDERAWRGLESVALVVMLLGMATGGWAVGVVRSTIPLALDARLAEIDVRPEKHPGEDDAHFLVLVSDDGARRELWVDQAVAQRVQVGERLTKEAGSPELRAEDRTVPLTLSREAVGLRNHAALACLLPLGALAAFAVRREGD